jgi:hypothetical protein
MKSFITLLIGCVIGAYLQHAAQLAHIPTLPRLPTIDSDFFMVGGLAVILILTAINASARGRK